ncbi:conserved unknown protein [Ectocarpus siliculosus]|uniref:FYVE-type domain-containing protein n=1 Tax=Ectocarpus siliculosus TaxID=2880 RepID=D7FYF4_ECTSI|nr:conserved unknown protein [Ectocarpus siliculosus]|eukprot:CBJ32496.1 conserved unknown protein [Ectocarpus siliculosus]
MPPHTPPVLPPALLLLREDLGYVPYDRAAVRSATDSGGGDTSSGTGGWTDGSPAGSSISGGGGGGGGGGGVYGLSSAGGAAGATVGKRKGFGRFKVFGAMKSLLRPQADVERAKNGGGNSSTERGTPTPPFAISPAPSFSPTNPGGVRVVASGGGGGGGGGGRGGGGGGEGRTAAQEAALAALLSGEHEGLFREEKVEGDYQGDGEEKSCRPSWLEGRREEDKKGEEEKSCRPNWLEGRGQEDTRWLGGGRECKQPGEGVEESKSSFFLLPRAPGGSTAERTVPPPVSTNRIRPRQLPSTEEGQAPSPLLAGGSGSRDAEAMAAAMAAAMEAAATEGAPATSAARQRGKGWRTKIKRRSRRRDQEPEGDFAAAGTEAGAAESQGPSPILSPAAAGGGEAAAEAAAPAGLTALGLSPGTAERGGKRSLRGEGSGASEEEAAVARLTEMSRAAQPVRELTPHLVEELDGGGGGFTLTVFKYNKQDQVPTPLVCGKFATSYEADRAAEAFSSPVWHEPTPNSTCAECQSVFRPVLQRRRHHCRNCGRLVCTTCALRFWPKHMLPHSYRTSSTERRVRVCRTCYSVGKAFRRALLRGSYQGAMEAHGTGCVNLRAPFSDRELPVHCAAAGGNVSLMMWLLEDRCCPIFMDDEKTMPHLDGAGRSVMAAAADSGRVEMMRYLTFTQPSAASGMGMAPFWRGLQACLRNDEDKHDDDRGRGRDRAPLEGTSHPEPKGRGGSRDAGGGDDGGKSCYPVGSSADRNPAWRSNAPGSAVGGGNGSGGVEGCDTFLAGMRAGAGGGGGGSGTGDRDPLQAALEMSVVEAGYSIYELTTGKDGSGGDDGGGGGGMKGKNACIVCFDRPVNCTFVPCGHHCCCMPCAESKLNLCPVCGVAIDKKIKTISA